MPESEESAYKDGAYIDGTFYEGITLGEPFPVILPSYIEIDESVIVQYKNYTWGMSVEETKQRAKDNGFEVQSVADTRQQILSPHKSAPGIFSLNKEKRNLLELSYADRFEDKDMSVTLVFTPTTERMGKVEIAIRSQGSDGNMIPILGEVLTDKYGPAWQGARAEAPARAGGRL